MNKYSSAGLCAIRLIIISLGVASLVLSATFYEEYPILCGICFDAGVAFALCGLIALFKREPSVRDSMFLCVFACIPYIFFILFFHKSKVIIDIALFFAAELILFIIHSVYENKICEAQLDYAMQEAEKLAENNQHMIDNIYTIYDSMSEIRNKIKIELINHAESEQKIKRVNSQFEFITLGKIDCIQDDDIPMRPLYITHYSYKALQEYLKEINIFKCQMAYINADLKRKSDIMEAEMEYRQNQYDSMHIFDKICAYSNSDKIKQVLKNQLSKFNWDVFVAFEKDDKQLINCLRHKVKFIRPREQSLYNQELMMRINSILTEGARYGLDIYGKNNQGNKYAAIASEQPEWVIDTVKGLFGWGENTFSMLRASISDIKNKKYIDDTESYIMDIRQKTNKQSDELASYYNEIARLVDNDNNADNLSDASELSNAIERLTENYIKSLNKIA